MQYKTDSALIMAHNAVRDVIGKFCLQSGMSVEREKPNMLLARSGADKRQVTDLVLKENETVTLVDVTIHNLVARVDSQGHAIET